MNKYLETYKIFFSNSVSYEAQYRADTWFRMILHFLWVSIFVLTIEIIYSKTTALGGWNKSEIYLLTAVWMVLDEIFVCFFSQIFDLPNTINKGDVDFVLTKPINSLFYLSANFIIIRSIFRTIINGGILTWVLFNFSFSISTINIITAFFLSICGLVVQFSFFILIYALNFWFVKIDNIGNLYSTFSHLFARYPLAIFPKTIRGLLLSVMPAALLAYAPTAALLGKLSWLLIFYIPIFTLLIFFCAVLFWDYALKNYSSASS